MADRMSDAPTMWVRRQWNDHRVARYRVADLEGPHWDWMNTGVKARAPQPFIHGDVWCDGMIEGELWHPCMPGTGPHRIKVCVIQTDNDGDTFAQLVRHAGPKPRRTP